MWTEPALEACAQQSEYVSGATCDALTPGVPKVKVPAPVAESTSEPPTATALEVLQFVPFTALSTFSVARATPARFTGQAIPRVHSRVTGSGPWRATVPIATGVAVASAAQQAVKDATGFAVAVPKAKDAGAVCLVCQPAIDAKSVDAPQAPEARRVSSLPVERPEPVKSTVQAAPSEH
jgi:hypothetical protein